MKLITAVLVAAAGSLAAATAHASEVSSRAAGILQVPALDTVTPRHFDIPAQPLLAALHEFSRQSSLRVSADSVAIAGLRSQPLTGTFTAAEALRRLIAGTSMRAEFQDDHNAVLHADDRSRRTATLDAVRVVASARSRARYASPASRSATKTDTPLVDVPQSVSTITRELIRDQAMQGMADVVRYVPGVTMGQGEGNRDQPTIRGNATTADFYVDGVRDDVQYFRDLYNVDRVEVLKGSNAMIFGRGGGGGIINRVTKAPQWNDLRELTVQGGSFDHKRTTIDLGQALGQSAAGRINGMFEQSGAFRDAVDLERYAINPTITLASGTRSNQLTLGYEFFTDHRTADRGVPSFAGRPLDTRVETFFGDPEVSYADARVHSASASFVHDAGAGLKIRNETRLASYAKIYQNVFPGAVDAAGDQVSLAAYNNATDRRNLFNQTDLIMDVTTGFATHTLLGGVEVGQQVTDNFRNTGYFNNSSTTISAPVSSPTVSTPVTFRQSATDADNHVTTGAASIYVQDQIAFGAHLRVVAGLRQERFDIRYHNNRTDSTLRRIDHLLSPRVGVVAKPVEALSFYVSRGVSYLPSSGDQFSSLTLVSKELEPERFRNDEIGAKWDVADRLSLTAAAYRLDRTNTRAPDPNDPTRTVQTGSQRTSGIEIGAEGALARWWQIAAGYANQNATITSATTAAPAGARVPLVPRTTLSLWNRFQIATRWGVGIGVAHRSDMYAAIDNRVTLPGFTEVDGAIYAALTSSVRAQLNVENLLNTRYFVSSNGNNNISPGSPRALRLGLTADFGRR